jgi:isopentenyl-diphosphate delta-isomerase type 2
MSPSDPDSPIAPPSPSAAQAAIVQRKEHHLEIVLDEQRYADPAGAGTSLDQVQLVHQALPELDSRGVDTSQPFLRATLRLPLLISCMTGGSGRGRNANHALAAAAQRAGIALGVGSIRPLLEDDATFPDFHVKPLAPDVPVLANLGAVQLRDLDSGRLRRLLERLEAQALVVHLNAGQELFQPAGDRDFRGLLSAIERAVAECGLPVIVKETGFGIRPRLVRRLLGCGVRYVDLAGAGGTNWVMVEGQRLPEREAASAGAFSGWGLPTGVLLALLGDLSANLIASGGLRHGVHLAKAVALGAALGGMALPFIRAAMAGGTDGALALIGRVEHELRAAMTLCGARSLRELRAVPLMQSAAFRHQVAELQRVEAEAGGDAGGWAVPDGGRDGGAAWAS